MENNAVNKILEAEQQGTKIINDAYKRAESIVEESRLNAQKAARLMLENQLEDNKKALSKAEQKGQTKAAVIRTDYTEQAEKLKKASQSRREKAVQSVLEIVLCSR